MGLLEGINVNEGRGTSNPFMQFGAPWINGEELKNALAQKNLTGVDIKSHSYIPGESLYKNEMCNGLELKIVDSNRFHPVSFGIALISALLKLYPEYLKERAYLTNANPSGSGHLDKLLGIKNAFDLLRSNASVEANVSQSWPEEIEAYLLYS